MRGGRLGVLSVLALFVLSRLRTLIFESMTANVNGMARFLSKVPYVEPAADWLRHGFAKVLAYWPWVFGGASVVGIVVVTLIGWWALSHVLTRLSGVSDNQKLDMSTRRRFDRAGSRAVAGRDVPVPRRRPRRARAGDAVRWSRGSMWLSPGSTVRGRRR